MLLCVYLCFIFVKQFGIMVNKTDSSLDQYNLTLKELYDNNKVDGGDIAFVAEKLELSRITVWKYAKGNGLNKNTAIDILNELAIIVEEREKKIERIENMKDFTNQD